MIKSVLCILALGAVLVGCNQASDVNMNGVKSKEDQIKDATAKGGFDKSHDSSQGQ